MIDVTAEDHRAWARHVVEVLATYREAEDLINIGAYVKGSNARIDRALAQIDQVNDFLKQDMDEASTFTETSAGLKAIGGES
jgi:flagellum-specific ATP synthase